MPFVKRRAADPVGADLAPIAALSSADAARRWNAARRLCGCKDAVPALASALAAETIPRLRDALMIALMRIGDEASVSVLLPYLRSHDAGQRASAIEALQAMPEAVSPFITFLLDDGDSDVRLLARELARNMPTPEATRLLSGLIEREQHPNVSAAAIEVLAEVGTHQAVSALQNCAERFAKTPFLQFAVSVAIAGILGVEC
jgi:HEAT repeat protein